MATASAIAKRTEKRQIEILEAVKILMAEVAELKSEIAGLKSATVTPPPTSRRPKK